MKTVEELQNEVSILIRDYLRHELGKDYYGAKLQALVVMTNTVTGKVTIDTGNVPLLVDAKKMLREAYEQLDRMQVVNALRSVVVEIFKGLTKGTKKRGKR